ncbi:diagnostic antigen gp50 [Echinococcus multilocularis]|uniref:Diagnostic antigen gp50 n=1 Tax=Echinococcus multilocularis TaxID=6211 RepID=A0A068Y0Y0_ECHMU|nr:diagnostic antigen gp50 [Echinococcus multilocularis]
MLKLAFFLITVAYYSGAEPVLWGSRIVGTPAGQSPTMYFRLPKLASIAVLINGKRNSLDIRDGKCYLNGNQEWGSPCQMDTESANITLKDVSKQETLQISSLYIFTSAAFFVPNCTFQKPKQGKVDLKTSFPLSRFGKGQSNVEVALAAQGARSQNVAALLVNGELACRWIGTSLEVSSSPFCRNMSEDTGSDLRTFVWNVTRNDTVNYTAIQWSSGDSSLGVSIDWTQDGASPEIEECNSYRVTTTTTSSSSGVTSNLATTTSSGPEVTYTPTIVIAPLSMLMLMIAPAG